MIVRAIDSNGDWLYGKGIQDYKSGLQAIEQSLKTRLSSFLNDCFFNMGAGIDWFTYIGGKDLISPNLSVRAVILNTPNITGITNASVDINANRSMTLTYSVNTIYGALNGQQIEQVPPPLQNFILLEDGNYLLTEDGNFFELE